MFSFFKKKKIVSHLRLTGVIGNVGKFKQGIEYSSQEAHWSNINHEKLGQYGIYNLWRINKKDLNEYSEFLINSGYKSNWKNIQVEKF